MHREQRSPGILGMNSDKTKFRFGLADMVEHVSRQRLASVTIVGAGFFVLQQRVSDDG